MTRRRFFAPEVVQTSSMDCGPAALASLLQGFGVPASYGRLREACQTDVDGSSIDTLEDIANRLGLKAQQTLVPVDHLLLPEVDALPAIVVVSASSGQTHFVVAWRRIGPFVQVMDPAVGRRYVRVREFLSTVYRHTLPLPAPVVEGWLDGDFRRGVEGALSRLGVSPQEHLQAAAGAGTLLGPPALDAAVRTVGALADSGALQRGAEASRCVAGLFEGALKDPASLPETSWSVRVPADMEKRRAADPDAPCVQVSGAVCVQVSGVGEPPDPSLLSPELRAALHEKPPSPAQMLWDIARTAGARLPLLALIGAVVAAAGGLVEALLFRAILDLGRDLVSTTQRLGAVGVALLWVGGLTLLELPIRDEVRRLARLLEARVRVAFLEKIPRLPDRYLASRPASDMAERAHALQKLRVATDLVANLLRTVAALVVTALGLLWLDPRGAPLTLLALSLSVAIPIAAIGPLNERDLRFRVHGGSLFRYFLDALLGLIAIRSHSAERSVRREQEALLVDWANAGRSLVRTAVVVEVVEGLLPHAALLFLVASYLTRAGEAGGVLLFIYWALLLPSLGKELALQVRQLPPLRNVTLRMLEPIGALEDEAAPAGSRTDGGNAPARAATAGANRAGVHVRLEGVSVVAGGHTILQDVNLDLPAGSHVAVVGPSGAGKSSLVGLLLGWHRAVAGQVLVDGEPLSAPRLEALRQQTAWVDPGVQLWNRSVAANLRYGLDPAEMAPIDQVLEQAELSSLLGRLPQGLDTGLGEGGGLVSGGEGQRVRLGRALARAAPRLVILDEPFRGLDRDRRRALMARARARWADATLVCITHDVEETRAMPRVLVIDAGRLVEDGAPAELQAREAGVYRALLDAEEGLRQELWGDPAWQHLKLSSPPATGAAR